MADRAFNAFYDVQFRKLGLLGKQLKTSEGTKAAIEEVSSRIDGLNLPTSIETRLDARTEAQLKSAVQALSDIRGEMARIALQLGGEAGWPDSLSEGAAYVLVWLAQLRARVLLDTTPPITVKSTNSKLADLRNETNAEGRYRRSLTLLESHPALLGQFRNLFADFDGTRVSDKSIAGELGERLMEIMDFERHLLIEVVDPLPHGCEPVPQAFAKRRRGTGHRNGKTQSAS